MVISNSYVSLPEGIPIVSQDYKLQDVAQNWLKGNSQEKTSFDCNN